MTNSLLAPLLVAFVCFALLHESVFVDTIHAETHTNKSSFGPGSLKVTQCPSQCTRRCSKTHYHKPCMFFCQKCCRKCLCVPPGYFGNKGVCPCYNNWKTKRGGPKCP